MRRFSSPSGRSRRLPRTPLLFSVAFLIAIAGVASADCLPPVLTAVPDSLVVRSHCIAFLFRFRATEGGNTAPADPITFTSNIGNINPVTGDIKITPLTACGQSEVLVTATNACGASTSYSFSLRWVNSAPRITNSSADTFAIGFNSRFEWDFNSIDPDPCDPALWSVAPLEHPVNAPTISSTGVLKWQPDSSEAASTWSFATTVTDPCGGSATCTTFVAVLERVPFLVKIGHRYVGDRGDYCDIPITLERGTAPISGFNLLLDFDYRALTIVDADLGADLGPDGCDWDYFTASYERKSDSGAEISPGRVRLIASAGAGACATIRAGSELARLKFQFTRDLNYELQLIPIRFAWRTCDDNTFIGASANTVYYSNRVFDFANDDPVYDNSYEITDLNCSDSLSYGGACSDCDQPGESARERFIDFVNGYIVEASWFFNEIGDVNLNGIAFELLDAYVLGSYLLYGPSIFDHNPEIRAAQFDQADVNRDGLKATIADLDYLWRVIVGDALPWPKLRPLTATAYLQQVGGELWLDSPDSVGGLLLKFAREDEYNLSNFTELSPAEWENSDTVTVLLQAGLDNWFASIPPGRNSILSVSGLELISAEVSDYHGNLMNVHLDAEILPTGFQLHQNYPNPFNPLTIIRFELPLVEYWNLDIFNVTGQLVSHFNGRGVGTINVVWRAGPHPSGVYFYRLSAGGFSATRKMVLLK